MLVQLKIVHQAHMYYYQLETFSKKIELVQNVLTGIEYEITQKQVDVLQHHPSGEHDRIEYTYMVIKRIGYSMF
jgi:hypothetical protein